MARSVVNLNCYVECPQKGNSYWVELVKEHYDANIAPVKAWAAGVELQAKHDRLMMGVAGRLANGKTWNTPIPYGYDRVDGVFVVKPEEAEWVHKIFRWYGEGASVQEIRERLITVGAKQKLGGKRYTWPAHYIRRLLRRKFYYTGMYQTTWGGETYTFPIPQIVDAGTWQMVAKRKQDYKNYPAGNLKAQIDREAMAAGKVYCKACNVRMGVTTQTGRHAKYRYYKCYNYSRKQECPDCARYVRVPRLDAEIWGKVWELLTSDKFERALEARIAELQAQEADAEAEGEKLKVRLNELGLEEQ